MSDRPLFQNADEQEAAYAGNPRGTEVEEGATTEGVVVPGAAAGFSGGAISGQMATSGGMMGVPAAGAEIAGAAHVPTEDRDDDGVVEDEETAR